MSEGIVANILVVDDDPSVSRAIGETLRDAGHDVKVFTDGAEAVREVRTGPAYDAAFVDWKMPLPGGFGAILLAAIPHGTKVVAMIGSSFDMPMDLRQKLGGVLTKPFSAEGLMSALASLGLNGRLAT